MLRMIVAFLAISTAALADIRVIDGDTFDREPYRYRLWGIDAPESAYVCPDGYPAGREATRVLGALLSNSQVSCEDMGRDRYGRVVARCFAHGQDIAAIMVREGFAWDWPRYSRGYYSYQQDTAQSGRVGLWAHGCQHGR